MLVIAFAVSMAFMGIGCKKAEEVATPAEEEGIAEEAPAEEAAVEAEVSEEGEGSIED